MEGVLIIFYNGVPRTICKNDKSMIELRLIYTDKTLAVLTVS